MLHFPGMRVHAVLLVAGLILFCAFSAAGQVNQNPPEYPGVLSGCEEDYPPFCTKEGGRAAGFSVELMRASLKAVNRDVTFRIGSWAQIKDDLAKGRLQALPMVARTPEREAIFDFTIPYLTMHGTIVVREDDSTINGLADLRGKRVAVLEEDVAHEYLRRADTGAIIVPLPSFATAMRELSDGKHDAVVIQKLLAFQLMKSGGLSNLKTVGRPLDGYTQTLCFAVRKGDQTLLSALNEGLSIVITNGTFRQLHSEWFAQLEAYGRSNRHIVVGGDSNYPPYEFLDRNGDPTGYNVELIRAIARHLGVTVEVRLGPWAATRDGLDEGRIDLVQGMFYSAERDAKLSFSPAHARVQHAVVVRRGSPKPRDLGALGGKSIIVMAGDIMDDVAIKQGYQEQLVRVKDQEEALRLLASGRHDCALVAKVPALFWIRQNGWDNLEVCDTPALSPEYSFAALERNEALLMEFSEGLAAIKQTGEYRRIQSKWLGPYESTSELATLLWYGAVVVAPLLMLLAGSLLWSRSLRAQVIRRTLDLQKEMDSSRKMAQALKASLREGELLAATASGLLRSAEPQKVVDGLCRQVMAHLNCDIFVNFLMDRKTSRLHLNASAGVPEATARQIEWLDMGEAVCGCAARDACRIVAEHIPTTSDPRTALVRSLGVKAYACHPMIGAGGEVLGTISFGTRTRETFDGSELALMKAVADHVAVAIARLRADQTIRESKAAAEQASRAKDQFIAMLSHELRTPLTPALAALSMLRGDERLPGDVRDDLEMVNRNIALEVRLISDLLDVSRIITGKLHMERWPTDVAAALREAASIVALDVDAKGQTLTIHTPGAPYMAYADPARLQQVFWNLLRNAIKFTPERGEIVVRARTVAVNRCPLATKVCPVGMGDCPVYCADDAGSVNQGANLVVEVTDCGIGIDPQMLPRLFNAFAQDETARSFGGLGLGLSICRAVVEMHGGSISASSEGLGRGSTFTVMLPVAQCPLVFTKAQPPACVAPTQASLKSNQTSSLVLLVEDHVDTARLMRRMLKSLGHEVIVAGSVTEGIDAVARENPDLLVSDLGLPDGTGLDLMRQLRERGNRIPGIVLSGYGTSADVEKSKAAGFAEHLVKPLHGIEVLSSALARLRS